MACSILLNYSTQYLQARNYDLYKELLIFALGPSSLREALGLAPQKILKSNFRYLRLAEIDFGPPEKRDKIHKFLQKSKLPKTQ